MNPKAALLLAALAAVFVGIALWIFLAVPGRAERQTQERELFDYKVQRVDRITGKRAREIVYDIEKQGDRWVYKTPPLGDADVGKIARLISDLRFDARLRNEVMPAGAGVPPEVYGLTKPRIEVTIHEPGRTTTFEIGAVNPTQDGVYLRFIPGGRVVLTEPGPPQAFDAEAAAYQAAPTHR